MATAKKKTYQYVATGEECQLINKLRDLGDDSIRLEQKLRITFDVEGRRVRRYDIEAKQIVMESAFRASEYMEYLLDERGPADEGVAEIEEQSVGNARASEDRDSVLGTQGVVEGHITQQLQPETWEAFRARSIPSSVNEVIFMMNEENVTSDDSETLRSRFPGVTFTYTSVPLTKPGTQALDKKQPLGVKTMMLELDEEQLAQSPMLEEEIRERYPWATIQAKASSNTSRKRIPRPDDLVTSGQNLDPIQHLCDLAEYTKTPPPTPDFEVYDPETFEEWDKLAPARKLEVAHACAIQAQYGKTIDGGGCGHCVRAGYRCKAYATELHSTTSSMSLGHACQNCRLKNLTCDLVSAATAKIVPVKSPASSYTSNLHAGTQTASPGLPADWATTPAHASTTKLPSLASRITPATPATPAVNDLRIRGAATVGYDDGDSNAPVSPGPKRTENGVSGKNPSSILRFAESIGLHFADNVKKVIHAMYTKLQQDREVGPYAGRRGKLEWYYSNLINLYILTYKRKEYDLAYIVLLRFQTTNCNRTRTLPDIEFVVEAFRHLPEDSPLCKWLAILYAFLWGTQDFGEYNLFIHERPGLDTPALSKLLYDVAYIRDPYTEGLDNAVLERWCGVHNHKSGSPDQLLCEEMRAGLKADSGKAARGGKSHSSRDAQETSREHGYSAKDVNGANDMSQESPVPKAKRKGESSPAKPCKKNKRGGGYGAGDLPRDAYPAGSSTVPVARMYSLEAFAMTSYPPTPAAAVVSIEGSKGRDDFTALGPPPFLSPNRPNSFAQAFRNNDLLAASSASQRFDEPRGYGEEFIDLKYVSADQGGDGFSHVGSDVYNPEHNQPPSKQLPRWARPATSTTRTPCKRTPNKPGHCVEADSKGCAACRDTQQHRIDSKLADGICIYGSCAEKMSVEDVQNKHVRCERHREMRRVEQKRRRDAGKGTVAV